MLPPPPPGPCKREYLFFALLTYFFESLGQLPAFYPLLFQCPEISPRIHLMWSFIPSVAFPSSTKQPVSSLLLTRDSFPKLLAAHVETQTAAVFTSPWQLSLLYRHFVPLESHFQHYHILLLCCTFIPFFSQFPFSCPFFCKMSHGFITGRQEVVVTHFLVRVRIG